MEFSNKSKTVGKASSCGVKNRAQNTYSISISGLISKTYLFPF